MQKERSTETKVVKAGGGANNYSPKVLKIPPSFTISKKVDLISFTSIFPSYQNEIVVFLKENGFRKIEDKKTEYGNYGRICRFCTDTKVLNVDILYNIIDIKGFPTLILNVHNCSSVIFIQNLCNYCGISPTIKMMELAIDIFTDEVDTLFEFIKAHLFLKYSRDTIEVDYLRTFYLNDIRATRSKAMRIYQKPIEGKKEFIRVELVLKRDKIRKLRLNKIEKVDELFLNEMFDFRTIDIEALENYFIKKHKSISGLSSRLSKDMVKNIFVDKDTLMEKVIALRRQNLKASNFIQPLNEFNQIFFDMVAKERFFKQQDYSPPSIQPEPYHYSLKTSPTKFE